MTKKLAFDRRHRPAATQMTLNDRIAQTCASSRGPERRAGIRPESARARRQRHRPDSHPTGGIQRRS
ncbi:hypothetical protein D779_3453 [Imhoffiella purpurea]|uniref:Uncharacterized protein n=1 Tax=Imhoffiella purpurea TaxID=1249627 RepID=W9V2G8_9GAMM|nr:hypothetical protein D779_3453 [Imhoffiella purpurea]